MNRIHIICIALVAAVFGMSAKPSTSTYSGIPRKDSQELESTEKPGVDTAAKNVKEADVRPEEAFKYGVQEFALIASDSGYFPNRLIVRRNIPVSIFLTGSSSTGLCFVQDDFGLRRSVSLRSVEEIKFLPTKVGQYKFYCPVKDIRGTLIVRD